MRRTFTLFLALVFATFFWIACGQNPDPVKTKLVLTNLNTAFQFESNDAFRYKRFAEIADGEGFGQAATLFRASSKSDSIHAAKHLSVIVQMGGNASPVINPVPPNLTSANIHDAVIIETNEYQTLYPNYIINAVAAGCGGARRSFSFALQADSVQALLFADPLILNLGPAAHPYWVCPVCGNIFGEQQTAPCPICNTNESEFIEVP